MPISLIKRPHYISNTIRNVYVHIKPHIALQTYMSTASRTVGREFASRPGHTKDHHKNGTNCLPA